MDADGVSGVSLILKNTEHSNFVNEEADGNMG